MNSKVSLLPLALTSLLLAACGGGGGGDNPPAQTMGTLGVSITDAPACGFDAVNVTVNVSTPDVAGFQRSQSQIAAQLGRVLARGERNS